MKIEILSKTEAETKKIGALIAREIISRNKTVFISLRGDLGSGKTTFVKGLARELKIKEDVTSPTFLIYKKYQGEAKLYHFDAYRINEGDLENLRFKDILKKENSIIVVEWSENIKKSLPKKRIDIAFSFVSPKERKLIVEDNSGIISGSFSL